MQLEAVRPAINNHAAAQQNHNAIRREFSIQGAKIVTYERGQGLPVLFLHGSPDTHAMWEPVIERLNGSVHAIAPDLPGFGESTLPDDFPLTLDNFADFIRDLIVTLNISEPVTLVSTDFGGHYGMAFLAKYPELVRGIVVSNVGFFQAYQWHFFARLYRVPVLGEILLGGSSRWLMRQTFKTVAPALPADYVEQSHDVGFGSAPVRKAILRMYRARESSHFAGWEDKLLALLKTKPALILWGDKDPFITPDFAERFVGAEIHHFPEFSHWLALENPDGYAEKLRAWLKKL
jgi:pimeloyl-ACP methyl ester carboxylesterase